MRLPKAELAVVEREKVVEYLLNAGHRYGASKARFFLAFGFEIDDWTVFAEALQRHGQRHEVTLVRQTGWGPRYEIDGELNTPNGREPRIRTVWQFGEGQIAPRLITPILWRQRNDQGT